MSRKNNINSFHSYKTVIELWIIEHSSKLIQSEIEVLFINLKVLFSWRLFWFMFVDFLSFFFIFAFQDRTNISFWYKCFLSQYAFKLPLLHTLKKVPRFLSSQKLIRIKRTWKNFKDHLNLTVYRQNYKNNWNPNVHNHPRILK